MGSFQQDFFSVLNNSHQEYISKINKLFENDKIIRDLSIESAEKLIEYIKDFKSLINSTCLLLDKINNIKNEDILNEKIDNELFTKMLPIMNIYRMLLQEKYNESLNNQSHNEIHNQSHNESHNEGLNKSYQNIVDDIN